MGTAKDIPERAGVEEVLSPTAIALRSRMLQCGHLPTADEKGVDELEVYGLAFQDPTLLGKYRPVALATAERAYMQEQREAIAAALTRMASASAVFGNVPADAVPGMPEIGVEALPHKSLATAAINQACDAETSHVYTAHPIDRRPGILPASMERDIPMLQRGVALKTVYLNGAREREPESVWAKSVSEHGAEVRTAEGGFLRMVIVGSALAIVPDYRYPFEEKKALKITNPLLITLVTEIFMQLWRRSTPWMGGPFGTSLQVRTDARQRQVLRMLLEGATYDTIAKTLRVGKTTVNNIIKELYELSGTDTLFALGAWWMSDAAKEDRDMA
ncbi:LuxR C-terminal-related transcriptional regulator [Streptomyces sp. NPDC002994]|uniref:LuxR C-terminal-related transcriptional regulator n=1 Tax=Streptomyces sp. NPDC002994 TaxID=3154441 RepID=UPI0033B0B0FE